MPLSHPQKATLADLAKKAWTAQPPEVKAEFEKRAIEALNDPLVSQNKVYDFWRRHWQVQSVGKESMADMSNRHYLRLKSLWEELAGKINTALRTDVHAFEEAKRQAMHLLKEATIAGGLAWPGYPKAIARTQCCGRDLDELNADELTHLMFTINNRARKKNKGLAPRLRRDEPPVVEPDEAPADPPSYDPDEPNPW